jgi:hypothetical protein
VGASIRLGSMLIRCRRTLLECHLPQATRLAVRVKVNDHVVAAVFTWATTGVAIGKTSPVFPEKFVPIFLDRTLGYEELGGRRS